MLLDNAAMLAALQGCMQCALACCHMLSQCLAPPWLPQMQRLAAALPVLAFNCAAPLMFRPLDASDTSKPNEMISAGMVEFAFVWLCSYKVGLTKAGVCWPGSHLAPFAGAACLLGRRGPIVCCCLR